MKKEKEKKKKKEKGKPGAVTDSWGKYGVVREVDMWYISNFRVRVTFLNLILSDFNCSIVYYQC